MRLCYATRPIINGYAWCVLPTTLPFPSHAIRVLVRTLWSGPYYIRFLYGPCWVQIRNPNPASWPIIRVLPVIYPWPTLRFLFFLDSWHRRILCPARWVLLRGFLLVWSWPYPAIRCGCRGHLLPGFQVLPLFFLCPGLLVLPLFF